MEQNLSLGNAQSQPPPEIYLVHHWRNSMHPITLGTSVKHDQKWNHRSDYWLTPRNDHPFHLIPSFVQGTFPAIGEPIY